MWTTNTFLFILRYKVQDIYPENKQECPLLKQLKKMMFSLIN